MKKMKKTSDFYYWFFCGVCFWIYKKIKINIMKIIEKIKSNFEVIVLVFLAVLFVKQCGANSDIEKLAKQSKIQSAILDSVANKQELKNMIEIEGLKVEKRMIQSTDRKILDVNRQSEIDLEIKKLESLKK
jgi:hypothetical protein